MAQTVTCTTSNCVITVKHKIYFANPDKMSDNEFWFCKQNIMDQIKERWEKPDFKYKCCKVIFKFEYTDTPGPDTDTKNLRTDWSKFNEENKWHDFGRSYQDKLGPEQSTGEWFVNKNILTDHYYCDCAAHEVGHELGAKDKYIEEWQNNGTKKILPDPVKDYPKDGIMFNHDGTVKQQDIDEIMAKLNADCPQECCGKR